MGNSEAGQWKLSPNGHRGTDADVYGFGVKIDYDAQTFEAAIRFSTYKSNLRNASSDQKVLSIDDQPIFPAGGYSAPTQESLPTNSQIQNILDALKVQ